jgi:hypothetical protein
MGWAGQAAVRTTIVVDEASGSRATIGAGRDIGMIVSLSAWLAGWAVGELAVLNWVALVLPVES